MHRIFPMALLSAALLACGSTRTVDRTRPTGPVQGRDVPAFRDAVADFDAGRTVSARRQFEALLLRTRGRPLQSSVRYYLAQIEAKKDPVRGGASLFKVADQAGPGDVRAMADVEAAALWSNADRCASVAARMDRRLPELGGALRLKALDAMTRCRKDDRTLKALESAAKQDPKQGPQIARLTHSVADGMPLEALGTSVTTFGGGPLGGVLRRRLAARADKAGRADLVAVARGDKVPAQSDEPGTTPTPTAGPTGNRLAVLLPLSGRSKRVGARLEGLVHAAFDGEDQPAGGPLVTVHDTGDAAHVAQVIERLAARSVAAVGVFDRKTAKPAAEAAAKRGFPLIMLTTSDAALKVKGPVWRAVHTPLLVARTAAGAAMGRGGKKAAIIYKQGGYGRTLGRWFGEAWRAGGGTVAGTVTWPNAKGDFGKLAKRIAKLKADTYFVPVRPSDAARLLSHLAAERVFARPKRKGEKSEARHVTVVGPPEWYDPDLLRKGGRYAEGVLIPVPFAIETAGGADLTDRLGGRLGRPPGLLDGLLADALRALDLAASRAQEDGQTITEVLRTMHVENGYTAGLHFDGPDAVRALFLMEVVKGRFEPSQ